mgnify:CR=1 FL=1
MVEGTREVWITGIGIVSCLGEGPEAHWQKLTQAEPNADATTFTPFVVHPLAPINFDAQIPKKGDQRQMENWQRIGTYAAGLALESAGVKGKADILARMDMIVAAGGGEIYQAGLREGWDLAAFGPAPACFANGPDDAADRSAGRIRPFPHQWFVGYSIDPLDLSFSRG